MTAASEPRVGAAEVRHVQQRCGWRVISSPRVSAAEHPHGAYLFGNYQAETMLGVSALSSKDVWTVGSAIEHWNGSRWTVYTALPEPPYAIAAVSPKDVWVVGGSSFFGGYGQALIDHWNGKRWREMLAPASRPPYGQVPDLLYAVGASSPHDVWVAGGSPVGDGEDEGYTAHWNGHRWTGMTPPVVNVYPNELYGIAPISADDVLTVGRGGYAAQWNGQHWQEVDDPVGANAIAALSETDAWAVGGGIAHWNGFAWSTVALPLPVGWSPDLAGVSAAGPHDIWAVGQMTLVDPAHHIVRERALVVHWDGARWTPVLGPSVHAKFSELNGISALPNGAAWAVGSQRKGLGRQLRPLIERYLKCSRV